MLNQKVWIGITVGVFVGGFLVGGSVFGIFSSSVEYASPPPIETMLPNSQMMKTPSSDNK